MKVVCRFRVSLGITANAGIAAHFNGGNTLLI